MVCSLPLFDSKRRRTKIAEPSKLSVIFSYLFQKKIPKSKSRTREIINNTDLSEMPSSLPSKQSDNSNPSAYSRKDKSLGVLCTNFLSLYDRDDVESIGLDGAALKLGVGRRRIYDIVNILESVGLVVKKAKNQYSWKGFGAMPMFLQQLKEKGLRENFNLSNCCISANASDDNEDEGLKVDGQVGVSVSSGVENRREKSLGLLTENFVKFFLCSDVNLITLDEAAMALLGDGHNSVTMRTKVRRIYDIANVLASMKLIEKTHHPNTGKTAFKWLGMKGNPKPRLTTFSNLNGESKKRVFGTEITNYSMKRSKANSSSKSNPKILQTHMEQEDTQTDYCKSNLEKPPKHSTNGFVFGPFAPVSATKVEDSRNKSLRQVQDWESLALSHCPQYRNQALSDLFSHYLDAWKSWYVEVAEKKQTQGIS